MKKAVFIILLFGGRLMAQTDSASIAVHKDPRLDLLVKKQIQINDETTHRNVPGYRIQVINSRDREKVFSAKAKIYQQYPELKPYFIYQPPYYKLKVGNFKTPEEAQPYVDQLSKLFPTGVFIVRDIIENPNDTN